VLQGASLKCALICHSMGYGRFRDEILLPPFWLRYQVNKVRHQVLPTISRLMINTLFCTGIPPIIAASWLTISSTTQSSRYVSSSHVKFLQYNPQFCLAKRELLLEAAEGACGKGRPGSRAVHPFRPTLNQRLCQSSTFYSPKDKTASLYWYEYKGR
jgi:hypothetical protein